MIALASMVPPCVNSAAHDLDEPVKTFSMLVGIVQCYSACSLENQRCEPWSTELSQLISSEINFLLMQVASNAIWQWLFLHFIA